jgi:shikimate kinase
MSQEFEYDLSHILWIGGATDAGKTTVSRLIAEKYGFQIYDYDRRDLPQIQKLAQSNQKYKNFLTASIEEKWVQPEPDELLQFTLQAFRDRFPLVIEELTVLPTEPIIVVEGHGLIPELVVPFLSSKHHAIWLVPSEEFKLASLKRRNKPSFLDKTTNKERATTNVYARDMLLAELVMAQALSYGLKVLQINGSRTAEEITKLVEEHFAPALHRII